VSGHGACVRKYQGGAEGNFNRRDGRVKGFRRSPRRAPANGADFSTVGKTEVSKAPGGKRGFTGPPRGDWFFTPELLVGGGVAPSAIFAPPTEDVQAQRDESSGDGGEDREFVAAPYLPPSGKGGSAR